MSEDHSSSRGLEPVISGARADRGAQVTHVGAPTIRFAGGPEMPMSVACAAPELLSAAKSAFIREVGARLSLAVERNAWEWPDDAPDVVSPLAEKLRAAIAKALTPSTPSPA